MKINISLHALFLFLFMSVTSGAFAASKIEFTLSFPEPQTHYVEVSMQVDGLAKDFVDVKMPVWAPGSYLIREFARNVEAVSAKNSSGKSLPVEKTSKNTWRVRSAKGNFTLNYRVYCFEISVRTPFVDTKHGFISPTGVFMFVDGMINHPATVTVQPYKGWSKISTGLEPVAGRANTFYAPDFDILFDSPIEVGNQDVFAFNAAGVNYEVAMYGGGNYNKERLKKDMTKIVEEETAVFGENPNKRYVFLVHNYNVGSGGLEHLNSTVLGVARNGYDTEAGYWGFLKLVAHEHFHLWNVKRLRPIALGPFDYENENYTTNLWIAEGFTSYYEKVILERAGLTPPERFVEGLAGDMAAVDNQPGSKVQSANDASFDAWIKQYRPAENSKNTTISYYSKGSLIALVMDLEIIQATNAKKNLDDVMKAMYEEYYKKKKRGYTDAEFKAMLEKVAGKSFDQIYQDYVYDTKTIDYNKYFSYAGISVVNDNANSSQPYLGIATDEKNGKVVVSNVSRGSAAYVDGINFNDEIIAIDGVRINAYQSDAQRAGEFDRALLNKKVGNKLKFTISRDGLVQQIDVTLRANPNVKYRMVADTSPTAEELAVRKKWLSLK
ncbi:MAG: peptidase [Sphingobacteriaceae bacterium]|jgi:predicted metalloprotease with PDZ domain|nr:peptidase [Sphingobacteriaceae bacterium]